jgi:hypothetical protein
MFLTLAVTFVCDSIKAFRLKPDISENGLSISREVKDSAVTLHPETMVVWNYWKT